MPFSHKTKYGVSTVELQNCSNHVLKTGIDTAEDTRSSSALSIPRKGGKTVENR
jgi:hypothetical protein